MQSIRRALKRGNAVIRFDAVTQKNELVWKKGTERKQWSYAVLNRVKIEKEKDKK